jgi:hypothetical protein
MHFFFFFGLTLSDFETGRSKGSALLRYDNKQSAQVTSLVAVIQKKKKKIILIFMQNAITAMHGAHLPGCPVPLYVGVRYELTGIGEIPFI